MRKVFALCFILLLVSMTMGCVSLETDKYPNDGKEENRFEIVHKENLGGGSGYIRVIHDNELNVTIYQAAAGYGYLSVSAIPDKDL